MRLWLSPVPEHTHSMFSCAPCMTETQRGLVKRQTGQVKMLWIFWQSTSPPMRWPTGICPGMPNGQYITASSNYRCPCNHGKRTEHWLPTFSLALVHMSLGKTLYHDCNSTVRLAIYAASWLAIFLLKWQKSQMSAINDALAPSQRMIWDQNSHNQNFFQSFFFIKLQNAAYTWDA